MNDNWILIDYLPQVNDLGLSANVRLLVDGKETGGFYDELKDKWFGGAFGYEEHVMPTHWKPNK